MAVKLVLTQTFKSPLAAALRASSAAHARRMSQLPTGAPDQHASDERQADARPGRAPLRVVAVGAESYAGVGTLKRNRKRAARRAAQRAKRTKKADVSRHE